MLSGNAFKPVSSRSAGDTAALPATSATLAALLSNYLTERSSRPFGLSPLVIPIDPGSVEAAHERLWHPAHPACADHADSDYCRESWQLHLAELGRQSQPHWHRCDYGRLCAIIPLVRRNRCVAATRVVGSDAIPEQEFLHHVVLLDVLVKDFIVSHAAFLDRVVDLEQAAAYLGSSPSVAASASDGPRPNHRKVAKALQYIDEQLSDPKLTIGAVARALDIHPYYLGQLFAEQLGERMNRFIVAKRIERAKTLLATTELPVKRISREVGFANPNWFSHVFRAQTGLTPIEFRATEKH